MKIQKWLLIALGCLALCTAPLLDTGCKHTFAQNGAYAEAGSANGAGNNALYNVDLAINASHEVIHTFVSFEYNNRALVQKNFPEATVYADKLRREAPGWEQRAVALRDVYKANPTSANKSALDTAMAILDEALAQAQQYFSKASKLR